MWFATDPCCTPLGRHLPHHFTYMEAAFQCLSLGPPSIQTPLKPFTLSSDTEQSVSVLLCWVVFFFFHTHAKTLGAQNCERISEQSRNLSPQLWNANPTCCQVSAAAFHPSIQPPVILQLLGPLRSNAYCFSFANVRGKKREHSLRLTPEVTESYHWQRACPPGRPAWERVCLRWGGPWPSARFTSHVFRLAFRTSQSQKKTGLHFINLVELKFGGVLFIPLNIGVQLKA